MPNRGDGQFGYLTPDIIDPATTGYICGRLRIPNNQILLAAFMGALLDLTREHSWEKFGTMTEEDTAYLCLQIYDDFRLSRGQCLIGSIFPYASTFPPTDTLICDGTVYLRVDYPDLYSVLEAAFLVDVDHFVVPDLRGYTVVGASAVDPALVILGVDDTSGEKEHTLVIAELATHNHIQDAHNHTQNPHSHTLTPHTHTESAAAPNVTTIGAGAPQPTAVPLPSITGFASDGISFDVATNSDTIAINQTTGSDTPHNNVQPSIGLHYCIIAK